MIDCNVPMRISGWFGTGTVIVLWANFFCITIWLPRLRTSSKPCRANIAQTSLPDSVRSLPKGYLDLCDKHFPMEALFQFLWWSAFKEQLQGFSQVIAGPLDCISLARHIQFGAQGNVPVSLSFNDCGKFHKDLLTQYSIAHFTEKSKLNHVRARAFVLQFRAEADFDG
jgi:hypothetical protein